MGLIDMATYAKTSFTQLCKNLQDPHHVARFQKICGVVGTFSGISKEKPHEQEQLYHGTCIKHRQGESDKYDIFSISDRHRLSKSATDTHTEKGGCKNGLLNGTGLTIGAGETGAHTTNTFCSGVASASPPENPTNGYDADSISAKDAESQNEVSSYRTAVKPMRKNSLTGDIGQEFLIENKFLYYLFTFGTELGNEIFYITFFAFFSWNIDAYVFRRLMIVWVWVMYLGQCTKDVMRWSRPASPPVVKVEMFYNSEYSMPSTHAMSGTAIPFELFLLTYSRWEYPFVLGLALSFSWCILVCLSRIYMGMHSILDVIAGFLYSGLILLVFQPLLDVIDDFNLTYQYAPLIIVSLHLGMGIFSFTLDTWSTSRGDTAQILGSGAGFALASHLNRRLGLQLDPPASSLPLAPPVLGPGLVGVCLLRFVLGMALLLLIRAVMKALTIPLVCRLAGVPAHDVRKARSHMEVELPYRYIVYGTVGFCVLFTVPEVFRWIGLS